MRFCPHWKRERLRLPRRPEGFLLLAALFAICVAASSAAAQTAPVPATPDFLFGRPAGSVTVRGSWLFARAGSDWYDFVTDQLTVNRRDFNAPGIAADVGITVSDRLEAVIGTSFSQASTTSEYRRLVDNSRLPINQKTELRQADVTGSLKLSLHPGRRISSLAWITRGINPYVGAGGGAVWYGLSQAGDFVDFSDFAVFTDVFESKGWTPTAHVFGGVDVRMARHLFATFDARYRWAAADLTSQWVDFDPIDLSGLRLSAGVNVPF
jgi:outer membrane protein W